MNFEILDQPLFTMIKVAGQYDSFTSGEICKEIIKLLNANKINIIIDTTCISGFIPRPSGQNYDLESLPLDLKDGETKLLFLEKYNQIGNNMFNEREYNRNGIPLMITVNKDEGLRWLLHQM